MMVEDMSPRIGAFGDSLGCTPNLYKLVRAGVRFTHVFATAGRLSPPVASRARAVDAGRSISVDGPEKLTGNTSSGRR